MYDIKWNVLIITIILTEIIFTLDAQSLERRPFSLRREKPFNRRKNINNPYFASVPPDHKDYVAMARYVVHQADWTSLATISTIDKIKGFPFSNIVSLSDGTVENSTGNPYFYLTPLDYASKDLSLDNRCTISVTLEQTEFCRQKQYDPEDPRCSRVMLSGIIVKMDNTTEEYIFAQNALFSRHPSMNTLPSNHEFYVAKMLIEHIAMLDWFGGPVYINKEDYFNFKPNKIDRLLQSQNIPSNTV